jgi:hypothetical protein
MRELAQDTKQSSDTGLQILLNFFVGGILALLSFGRGANCQAGFHFLTTFFWVRVLGPGLPELIWRLLDAGLNGAIVALLTWFVAGTTRQSLKARIVGLVVLDVAYASLMFAAFRMKDCL